MIEIPLTGYPNESVDLVLNGRPVRLRADYANLTNTWRIDLFDRSTTPPTPLVRGVPVLIGVDILKPYGLGLGSLVAVPNERPRDDAGRGELGVRVNLVQANPEELTG